jgi:plastocyanin
MNLSFFALRRGAILTITMLLAFALAACSPGDGDASEPAAESAGAGDGGSGTATVTDGAVEIVAADLAFDVTTIEATAGEDFTITLVNDDTAPHNISIYSEEGGEQLALGPTGNGGETVETAVSALEPGEYYFQCDIHPDMNGTLVVTG